VCRPISPPEMSPIPVSFIFNNRRMKNLPNLKCASPSFPSLPFSACLPVLNEHLRYPRNGVPERLFFLFRTWRDVFLGESYCLLVFFCNRRSFSFSFSSLLWADSNIPRHLRAYFYTSVSSRGLGTLFLGSLSRSWIGVFHPECRPAGNRLV